MPFCASNGLNNENSPISCQKKYTELMDSNSGCIKKGVLSRHSFLLQIKDRATEKKKSHSISKHGSRYDHKELSDTNGEVFESLSLRNPEEKANHSNQSVLNGVQLTKNKQQSGLAIERPSFSFSGASRNSVPVFVTADSELRKASTTFSAVCHQASPASIAEIELPSAFFQSTSQPQLSTA